MPDRERKGSEMTPEENAPIDLEEVRKRITLCLDLDPGASTIDVMLDAIKLADEVERLRTRVGTELNEARGEAAVQKRIERATQPLLDRVDGLREALMLTRYECEFLHHAKKDQHGLGDQCPVESRVRAALEPTDPAS
jgi:hypothetical protein